MTIERCNKAGSGFECVRLAGHEGACDLISSEVYAKTMQSAEHYILSGDGGFIPCKGGLVSQIVENVDNIEAFVNPTPKGQRLTGKRADCATYCPTLNPQQLGRVKVGEYTVEELCKAFGVPLPVDHQDEIGRVWDVLHAAGINSAGGLSASEGVKQLVEKLHAVKKLANERFGRTSPLSLCDKCNGCGWEQPDVAIEVCSKCDGKGVLI